MLRNPFMATFMAPLTFAASTAMAGPPHQHGGDVIVGVTASNQIAVEFDAKEAIELPPVDTFLQQGWALDEPGFNNLVKDEPAEGFFVLPSGAIIVFELVAPEPDPALKFWTPGFISVLDEPGEQWVIGPPNFGAHGSFHIDSQDPAFDPDRQLFSLTFLLRDAGTTGLLPSEPITLSFTPVPEPSGLWLLPAALLVARRRSRSRRPSPANGVQR